MDARKSESSAATTSGRSDAGGAWSAGSILFWSLAGGAGVVSGASVAFRMASMRAARSALRHLSSCNLSFFTDPLSSRFCPHLSAASPSPAAAGPLSKYRPFSRCVQAHRVCSALDATRGGSDGGIQIHGATAGAAIGAAAAAPARPHHPPQHHNRISVPSHPPPCRSPGRASPQQRQVGRRCVSSGRHPGWRSHRARHIQRAPRRRPPRSRHSGPPPRALLITRNASSHHVAAVPFPVNVTPSEALHVLTK
jgi:hypothetical protein